MHEIRDMERLASRKDPIEEVYAERRRQVDAEGYDPKDDDRYTARELRRAAAAYLNWGHHGNAVHGKPPADWPWPGQSWKPKDERRDLIRAAALIIAEIERLDRAEALGDGSREDHTRED